MFHGDVSELVWENGHLSQVNFGQHREAPVLGKPVPFASPLLDSSEVCKNVDAAAPCGEDLLGSDETSIFFVVEDDYRLCADRMRDAASDVRRKKSCDTRHHPHQEKNTSNWSREASNDISSFSGHREKVEDDDAYQTDDEGETVTRLCKLSPKRKRNSEEHRLLEKRRRKKINDKLKTLHNLIPNRREEVAKALLLDQVIMHIKALQRHLQMMTMSSNMYRYMAFPVDWGPMQMHPSLVCLPHSGSSPGPFLAQPQMKYPPPPVMFPLASFQDAFQAP